MSLAWDANLPCVFEALLSEDVSAGSYVLEGVS